MIGVRGGGEMMNKARSGEGEEGRSVTVCVGGGFAFITG